MGRKLPILVERSMGHLRAMQAELGQRYDRAVVRAHVDTGLEPTCEAGCSNCCYHPTRISIFEGAMIYQHLVNHGRWTGTLRKKIQETAQATKGLASDVWLLAEIPCPLLNDKKECIAYQARPLVCRTRWSFLNATSCAPHQVQHDKPLLPQTDVLSLYHALEEQALKGHGTRLVPVALSLAILLGEKLYNGELDIEDATQAIQESLTEE